MSDRSLTIWNLLIGITIFSVLAISFKLFPMNTKYTKLKKRSANVQFGTDKELENIISYLEGNRSEFQFSVEKTPMLLTNVLGLADGSGRRVKRNRNAIRVAFIYQRQNSFQAQIDYRGKAFTVMVGDSIPNIGVITLIDGTQVKIELNGNVKSYPAPGYEAG